MLIAATVVMFCFNRGFWLLTVALAWGILCELEGIVFSVMLPDWAHDVKALPQAIALRREMLARRAAATPVS